MNFIKIFLVNFWIVIYRVILFPILTTKDKAEACSKKYFSSSQLLVKRRLLIVAYDDAWVSAWLDALRSQHYVISVTIPREGCFDLGYHIKKKCEGQFFDITLWYLSANQYTVYDLTIAKATSKVIARIHWDDEFNFFLPTFSSPLRDAHLFDFLFSSSSLAVCAYRKLGHKSELFFNGVMTEHENCRARNGYKGKISKIVFIGSYTYNRKSFLLKLSKYVDIFVFGRGWPDLKGLTLLGQLENYKDLCKYDAILNLNFISLSNKYTHTKFRDFEFLGLGVPIILHKSLENKFISKDLIYFDSFDSLQNILNKRIGSDDKGVVENYSELTSANFINRTLDLINLKKEKV